MFREYQIVKLKSDVNNYLRIGEEGTVIDASYSSEGFVLVEFTPKNYNVDGGYLIATVSVDDLEVIWSPEQEK